MDGSLQRILCVDDEPEMRSAIRLALERIGHFDVLIGASGAEALDAGPAFRPDLMIFDVVMPVMDGPAVLAEARRLPDLAMVPAIFLTGKERRHEIAAFQAMGVIGVITKPFDIKGLAGEVRNLWENAVS
jgi:two-component system OmpR family response regulator